VSAGWCLQFSEYSCRRKKKTKSIHVLTAISASGVMTANAGSAGLLASSPAKKRNLNSRLIIRNTKN